MFFFFFYCDRKHGEAAASLPASCQSAVNGDVGSRRMQGRRGRHFRRSVSLRLTGDEGSRRRQGRSGAEGASLRPTLPTTGLRDPSHAVMKKKRRT